MNEIGRLSREKFNNNFSLTVKYVMEKLPVEDQRRLTSDLTEEQSRVFIDYLNDFIKNNNLEEEIKVAANEEYDLAVMNLTKEDVQNMEVNPFKAKLGKDLLKLIVLNLGVAGLYMITSDLGAPSAELLKNVALGFSAFLTTSFSLDTIKDLLAFFKFKKLKKQYEQEKNQQDDMTLNNSGRSL